MLYRRGKVWWMQFKVRGQRIRESTRTTSKVLSREVERNRRRELEQSINGITKREVLPLFKVAAEEWIASKATLTPLGRSYYRQYIRKLNREFGNCFMSGIDANDISAWQRKRRAENLSGRQVNCEVATLRAILKHYGLWANLSHRVKMFRERSDAGRAISIEDETKMLDAIAPSQSSSSIPFSCSASMPDCDPRRLARFDTAI